MCFRPHNFQNILLLSYTTYLQISQYIFPSLVTCLPFVTHPQSTRITSTGVVVLEGGRVIQTSIQQFLLRQVPTEKNEVDQGRGYLCVHSPLPTPWFVQLGTGWECSLSVSATYDTMCRRDICKTSCSLL